MIKFSKLIQTILTEWTQPKYEANNVQKNFEIIKKSIQTGGVIEFYYLNVDGLPKNQYRIRFVEPFDLGVNAKGNMILSGYWVAKFSKSGNIPKWRSYSLSNIKQLRIVPRKQRIVRDLWAGGTNKLMTKVLVSIADYFKPTNGKRLPNKFRQEKQKQDVAKQIIDKKPKFVEPKPDETGDFEEDDLTVED